MSLKVLKIGGSATLQGAPQPGRRHFGVPTGGAFDQESLALGNALLGNAPDALALELTLMGGMFLAEAPLTLSLVGAVGLVSVGGRRLAPQSRFGLETGERLEVGAFEAGVRAYLCVQGGWGGHAGEAVFYGSELQSPRRANLDLSPAVLATTLVSLKSAPLRYVPEPDLPSGVVAQAESHVGSVELDSDRRGVRLAGFPPPQLEERASEPVVPGTIQWTPGGGLLILGPDGPTIGGYRRLGFLCGADMGRVGQLGVGEHVAIAAISLDEARAITQGWRDRLEARCRMLRLSARA
ncbi:MAG: hypothetical protein HZC36_15110 [Armatimonadetes bacterium]|nr:hypothetical protein [Armatimonadota bacterium]